MPVATFDTVKFANTLKAAGVPPQQAEAEAAAFAEVIQLNFKELVTKDDLRATADAIRQEIALLGKDLRREAKDSEKAVRQEIAKLGTDLRQEAKDTEKAIRQEAKDVEQRLGARIDLLAAELKTVRAELKGEMYLLKWMLGVLVGGVFALLVRSFFFRGTL